MTRRFLIEVEAEFPPDTDVSDIAFVVDMHLHDLTGGTVRDFDGELGCIVYEVVVPPKPVEEVAA